MLNIKIDFSDVEEFIRKLEGAEFDRQVMIGLRKGMELATADIQRTAVINAPKLSGELAADISKSVYDEAPTGWG